MFTIKTFRDLSASVMLQVAGAASALSDYNAGSVARTTGEAIVKELAVLYQLVGQGLADGIEQATYTSFNFPLRQPQPATTFVTVTRDPLITTDVTISAGTRYAVPGTGKVYAVQAATVMLSAFSNQQVYVVCQNVGSAGNTPPATITQIIDAIPGILSVSNGNRVFNGRDNETIDQRRVRFQQFIQGLARGTNAAIQAGALQTALLDQAGNVLEQVQKTALVEAVGSITVYVHNGVGATSPALIALAQQVITGYIDSNGIPQPGYKVAGIPATVLGATDQVTPVTVNVNLASGYTLGVVQGQVMAALQQVFANINVGATLHVTDLQAAIRSVQGIVDCQVTLPAANVVPAPSALVLPPATFTVTAS